jgi:hypothetical protein
MLLLMIGKKLSSPWTSVESELARATSCPVGMRPRLSKSSDCRWSCMSLRRSYWTSSATRPPR